MIKKFGLGLVVLGGLLLTACQEEKVEDVLNFSDIVPESERYGNETGEQEGIGEVDSLAILRDQFVKHGVEVKTLTPLTRRMFPERFSPKSTEKYELVLEEDTVHYFKWRYKDSTKVMNAFYNWLDCFGEKCKSIYVNESRNMHRSPLKIMISDTTLIYIKGSGSIDFEKWDSFHEALGYKKDWNILVEQRKSGRAKWYIYRDNEKIPFE